MSKGERVTTCLVICAIGVTLIPISPISAIIGTGLALLAGVAALYEGRRREPPKLTDDQIARESAAKRLDAIAQSAIELAASETDDNEFTRKFFRRWSFVEFHSLHAHLQTRFGLSVRDELLTRGPTSRRVDTYVSAMRETAERLRNEP